jgi:DNA repair protein RadC
MEIKSDLQQLSPDQRPRERLIREGSSELEDVELIALVIGQGTRKQDALSIAKSLVFFLKTRQSTPTLAEIASLHGIGTTKACQIVAILELSRRFLLPRCRATIQSPRDALPYLTELRECRQEKVAVLTLDGHHQILGTYIVTVGLANQSQIHPRETFHPAIRDQAVSILVAHNHPSGHLEPSDADLTATKRLSEASRILGIPMLDHLIVAETGVLSLREKYPGCFV